jgi:peptidoglycan-associated lipoprotein
MRALTFPLLSVLVVLLPVRAAVAQSIAPAPAVPKAELAFTHNWVRTNAPPADCGCFNMNGGSISFAYHFKSSWAVVAEAGAVANTNVESTGRDLGLVQFLAGARYTYANHSRLQPFGQTLLGGVHAAGTLAPTHIGLSSSDSFALATGGGLDINLTPRVALRAVKADYYLTLLPNPTSNSQNNLRLSTGIIFRLGRK